MASKELSKSLPSLREFWDGKMADAVSNRHKSFNAHFDCPSFETSDDASPTAKDTSHGV